MVGKVFAILSAGQLATDSLFRITNMRVERERFTQCCWSWRCGVALCLVAIVLVTTVAVVSDNLTKHKPDESADTPATEPLRFVERDEWLAQPPAAPPNKLSKVPAPYVIISHTASTPCNTTSQCVLHVRRFQTFHMDSMNFSDIAYNYLVGGDGSVYVGRGWDVEGAHTYKWNSKSIGLSFIGTFNDVPPVEPQLQAALKLLELGMKLEKLKTDYILLGHRQVSKTESPGEKLFEIIKTWKHWSAMPSSGLSLPDS